MVRLHIKENYILYRYLTDNYGKDARVTAIVDTTEVLLLFKKYFSHRTYFSIKIKHTWEQKCSNVKHIWGSLKLLTAFMSQYCPSHWIRGCD